MADFRHRTVAALMVMLMLGGCTKTVDVPLNQVGDGNRDLKTPHRIHMADGSEYSVRQFAVNDTTLTIENLTPSDPRFDTAPLPIVLPLKDVKSIQKSEPGLGGFAAVALIGLACVAFFVPVVWIGGS